MRVDGNQGSTLHYEPNSYGEWEETPENQEPSLPLSGGANHWDFREDDDDYYTQPGILFNLMDVNQKQVLFENTARNMDGTTKEVQLRHIGNCYKADSAYGEGVANALGISAAELESVK